MSVEVAPIDQTSVSQHQQSQRTLRNSIRLAGRGLFTGESVNLFIEPAPVGHGLLFQRSDCPGAEPLRPCLNSVKATPRCTILGNDYFQIQTVEHLLSALRAFQIDNALITLDGPEVPIGDGSSRLFVQSIRAAGVEEQGEAKPYRILNEPIFFSENDTHIIALPAQEFRISYTLHYPQSPLIGSQFYSFVLNEEDYEREIAPCRTFCLYEEIAPLIERGMIKGGGVENALVIGKDQVLNPDGVRFADEMVRHKILDMIGDLSLVGSPFLAHIIAIRSGHATNVRFAQLIYNQLMKESSR